MGLLKDVSGKPIQWLPLIHSREIERQKKKALDHLLYIWDKYRNRDGDPYLWGDEASLT